MPVYTQAALPLIPSEDEIIRSLHATGMLYKDIAEQIGRTTSYVRNYCYRIKLRRQPDWTEEQLQLLRDWYADHSGKRLDSNELARRIGKDPQVVRLKASRLGLTERGRDYGGPRDRRKYKTAEELSRGLSENAKRFIAEHGHPRGMLGRKHRAESIEKMTAASHAWYAASTPEQRSANARKAVMTRVERYGTAGPVYESPEKAYSRTKGGRREDLDNRYFRSAWEANYCRYLNWLVEQGQIISWEYEADVFVFHGETRGAITYRPDFKVTEKDGSVVYHEVKGWMDGPSKTRLQRMKKHYPEVKVIVIGEAEYKAVAKWKALIPEWEGR